jgi:hypothetical protein
MAFKKAINIDTGKKIIRSTRLISFMCDSKLSGKNASIACSIAAYISSPKSMPNKKAIMQI